MATLETLNFDQFTDLLVAFAKNLLPEDDFSRGSNNWARNRIVAAACADLQALVLSTFRDLLEDTAEDSALDRLGKLGGLPRKGAVIASGENAGLIRGDESATWTTSDLLQHSSGQQYLPSVGGTIGSTGQELVGLVAATGGEAGNLDEGEVLTWVSAPTDIENEVELQAAIDGGAESEGNGPYRTRVLNRRAQPAMGGNANDYEQWILESSNSISFGYVWPNRNGNGSVDIGALKSGRGSTRLLDAGERSALLSYVDLLRPVTGQIRALEITTEELNCEVVLVPESDAQFTKDWDDSAPPIVSAWSSITRTLTFTGDRPTSMAAGHRLVVQRASGEKDTSGVELVVESLSGTDAVVLVSDRGQNPGASNEVYSGGPIIEPVRQVILALFDSLGPRGNEFGTGKWVSTLYHSHLFEKVQTTLGVLNSTIVLPAADTDPTLISYPSDESQINVLVPGNIFVRYA